MDTTRSFASRRPPHQGGLIAQQRPAATNFDTGPDLFGIDVLPEQFFPFSASCHTERPEAVLMRAVLADALVCFQQGFVNRGVHVQRLAQEAGAWFLSDDDIGALLGEQSLQHAWFLCTGVSTAWRSSDLRGTGVSMEWESRRVAATLPGKAIAYLAPGSGRAIFALGLDEHRYSNSIVPGRYVRVYAAANFVVHVV